MEDLYSFESAVNKKIDSFIGTDLCKLRSDLWRLFLEAEKKRNALDKRKKMNTPFFVKSLKEIPYEFYLKTKYWHDLSLEVRSRDCFRCRACGSEENLNVHHIRYGNLGDYKKEKKDLITVCTDCHKRIHKISLT